MTAEKNTILVVDDHPVFRRGLLQLLETEKDLYVVGEASDGLTAIEMVRLKKPDIVIMDINMPNLNGIEATRRIVSEFPGIRVVALSVHSSTRYVRDMFEAGASGYILKERIPEEMIDGIRAVIAGDVYLDRSISNVLISDYRTLISTCGPEPDEVSKVILSTKLYPASLVPQLIPRPRLVETLEQGAGNPMTLIAAPAGFGKSVIASQWLSVSKLPGAWVSLDEEDNNCKQFLAYILAAIKKLFPENEWETDSLLDAARLPSAKVITRYFLNDLEKIDRRFILVLDDYHNIRNTEVHDFIEALIVHPSPVMHLAMLTRRDPPLPLVSLRSRGMLTEIALRQIAFNVPESKSLLERYLRTEINEETAQILQKKMEGWVTGLCLVALSMGKENDPERLMAGMAETTKFVRDYLVEEVLSKIPSTVRGHVLRAAFLDRFCAPLCDAIFFADSKRIKVDEDMDGQEFIDWLIKSDMFLISMGVGSKWVRYHQVFQQLLQNQATRQLGLEQITEIHSRAGVWFAENGFIDEAITHALAAGDAVSAAEVVERSRRDALDSEKWQTLEKWLDRLPDDIQQKRPGLMICRAWIFFKERRFAEILPLITRVESLLVKDSMNSGLANELDFFRGILCYFDGQGASGVALFEKVIKHSPESSFALLRVEAEYWLGMALHLAGRKAESIRILHDKIRGTDIQEVRSRLRLHSGLCSIHLLEGEYLKAFHEGRRMQEISRTNRFDVHGIIAMYIQGNASLQMFDLDTAQQHLGKTVEKRYIGDYRLMLDAMAGLAVTFSFRGAFGKAEEILAVAEEYARWTNMPFHEEIVGSCRARIDLMRGDLGSASRWRRAKNPMNGNPTTLFFLENPAVTECRVLIALGTETGISEAVSKLKKLRNNAGTWQNNCLIMEVLVLISLAVHRQGRSHDSLALLEQALVMAQPSDWLRPFVEAGPQMAELLEALKDRKIAVAFIGNILAALRNLDGVFGNTRVGIEGIPPKTPDISRAPTSRDLIEPLTNRELDVLELLAQRFQNKEIAEKLFISSDTVKGHLKNIFQKLAAVNRRDAVEKAKQFHII